MQSQPGPALDEVHAAAWKVLKIGDDHVAATRNVLRLWAVRGGPPDGVTHIEAALDQLVAALHELRTVAVRLEEYVSGAR